MEEDTLELPEENQENELPLEASQSPRLSENTDEAPGEYKINNRKIEARPHFKEEGAEKTPQNLYNGVDLILDYSFGHHLHQIENSAVFVSDDNIVYPCGKHLVMLDLNTRKSEFIRRNDDAKEVTAMITSFSKKKELMIIIAETKHVGPPQVSIYYPMHQGSKQPKMKLGSWIVLAHENLTDDYTIPFIEVNKRYLISLAKSPTNPPVLSYFRIDAERFSIE